MNTENTFREKIDDLLEKVERDIEIEREKFNIGIAEIRKKYRFGESGLAIVRDAIISFTYEDLRTVVLGKGSISHDIPVKVYDSIVEVSKKD